MISLQAVLLLSMGIAATVAWDPDCTRCAYQNGIGFVKGDYCQVYYMCTKKPGFKILYEAGAGHDDLYNWQVFCCAPGLAWDEEHLTCKRDSYCNDTREKCPDPRTTTDNLCPNQIDKDDETKYFTQYYEHMMCPYGTVWSQDYCTCVSKGVHDAPCRKILHYTFDQTFDSDSCYNFAVGEPYGKPYTTNNMLCLNGTDQFLAIPFLRNWFAWNPVGKSFTLCFFIKAGYQAEAGVFSTNCYQGQDSLLDLCLEDGYLVANLGGEIRQTGKEIPSDYWSKVCVVFDNGDYKVYVNSQVCGEASVGAFPINSHSDPTVGYVEGKPPLKGYFDDVCFWTYALSSQEIIDCQDDGPSSVGQVGPPAAGP